MSLQQETMKTVEGTVAGCLSQIIALGIILSIGNGALNSIQNLLEFVFI